MHKRLLVLLMIFFSSVILLTGCLFTGEQSLEEMDPPQNIQTTSNLEDVGVDDMMGDTDNQNTEEDVDTVNRELYLLDENGMVVPQSLPLPSDDSKEVAKQVLEYLVKDGPVTSILPNGFQAVLPAGTQINEMNIEEDGTLIVDLSEEFKEYRAEDELKIIQAMTFTLTQFDTVDRIKLRINGVEQDAMPVNGTPLSNGYSRADGINIHVGDIADITESVATTLYFPAQHDSHFYYVPVTVPLDTNDSELYSDVVMSLIEGPGYINGLQNVFQSDVELTQEPVFKDGVLTLTFNESIFNSSENKVISDEVMSTLVLSLTEQPGVESVQVMVEGIEKVYNENGETFSKPVTRDDIIEASGI